MLREHGQTSTKSPMGFRSGLLLCSDPQVYCCTDVGSIRKRVRCGLDAEARLVLAEKKIKIRSSSSTLVEGLRYRRLKLSVCDQRTIQKYCDGIG